jgi:ACS family hexuronate transporter-like MFS transporter
MKTVPGLRWWIIALICGGTIINYLARNSLAVLAPQLKETLSFSTQQYSYVVAAFQVAYTLMQPIGGMIVDALGVRAGFALFALAWSAANMLHGLAHGWGSLAFFRGLLGLSEAGAIPAGIKAVSEWFPPQERSVAVGWFNTGTSLGALIAPPVTVWLALNYDWRAAFVVTGGLGLLWAAAWYGFYRRPREHRALSAAERAHIEGGEAPTTAPHTPLLTLLGSRQFWAVAIPRFLAEPAWQTFSFWIPLYLATERGMDLKQIALFAWTPFLAADLGGLFGGYLAPFLMRRGVKLVASRVWGVALGAVLMIAPGCIGLAQGPYLAIALFCVGGFAHQVISALLNTLTADVFPRQDVGTANGFVGMAGWTGGLLFSLTVGALADSIGYGPLFASLAVFDIIGAIVLASLIIQPAAPAAAHG